MLKSDILVITIFFGVSGVVLAVFYFSMPPGAELIGLEFFIIIECLIATIISGIILYFYTQKRTREYLKEKGIRGTATLLSIKRSSWLLNLRSSYSRDNYTRFKLKFRIDIPGIEPYNITRSIEILNIVPGLFKIGSQYTALVDPNNHKRVRIRTIEKLLR
ncbi:MAG: hypothetical protein ACFFCM_00660 [Promethearchaeota archaeon]